MVSPQHDSTAANHIELRPHRAGARRAYIAETRGCAQDIASADERDRGRDGRTQSAVSTPIATPDIIPLLRFQRCSV